jgi:hypothetical protein
VTACLGPCSDLFDDAIFLHGSHNFLDDRVLLGQAIHPLSNNRLGQPRPDAPSRLKLEEARLQIDALF